MIPDDALLRSLAAELGEQLVARNMLMATAESCTGGWVSKIITDLDGCSVWFECALVTYHNEAKHALLGVSQQTLNDYGAVSQPAVKEMVLGLLDRCNASIGVSISGIAGPGGGSDEKPVGTVWMAWARPGQVLEAVKFQFEGDREAVRRQAVYQALLGVKRLLDNG
ncbi:MAG: nicotinamide-nucleotide amidohydrolase family protein [Gammaproteobacteria bacterium]|nr:nicotinamide-nucleotide amidohydrolase family protein [Gammaproteobacteria bacterium]MDH5736529.1 nicotinamide-nucleotide amidohydrolase family protein [Gammaproteobacteria bacterium]